MPSAASPRTIDLVQHQLVTFEAPHGHIELTHGCAWLTEVGGVRDTFLAAGDAWCLTGRSIVLSALSTTRVRLVGAIASDRTTRISRWRRLVRTARRHAQRMQFGPAGMHPWL